MLHAMLAIRYGVKKANKICDRRETGQLYKNNKRGVLMIIYKATNKINGMCYIGQTSRTLKERMQEHKRHHNTYFDNAINKYGIDNFEIKIIDKANSIEELNAKEMFWISFFDCMKPRGYNLCEGGGTSIGYHHTEESKSKMSISKKTKCNYYGENNPFYGKTHSHEQKLKWALERKGFRHTKEAIAKIRRNQKNSRKVVNLDTGKVFDSIALAAEFYNLKREHIYRVCNGIRKKTGGYRWAYVI